MGPGAPKSYKKGWNSIGFIRPGASGPRGTKKAKSCKKPRKIFCVFAGICDFHVKSWKFLENHHFALSQTLAQTNGLMVPFSSATLESQVPRPNHQKGRNSSIFSIPAPKSALFRPESVFWEPGSKPFINARFWEVFWRPGTGKVHFLPKKSEIAPQNRKSGFWRKKCNFRENAANLPKRYLFCFKRLLQTITFVNSRGYWPQKGRIYQIPPNFRKFLGIW
jgi:hypothetical protein